MYLQESNLELSLCMLAAIHRMSTHYMYWHNNNLRVVRMVPTATNVHTEYISVAVII